MTRGFGAVLLLVIGCGASEDAPPGGGNSECTGRKCDDADAIDGEEVLAADIVEGTIEGGNLSCDLLNNSKAPNHTAKNFRSNFGKFLHDPVAELILRNGACPSTFTDVMVKLNELEPGCSNRSAIVSETAQASKDDPDIAVDYRAVTTRFTAEGSQSCLTLSAEGDEEVPREPHELLFSTFGYSVGGDVPMNAEFIGFDRTRGVFNYYTLDPRTDEDGNFVDKDGNVIDLEEEPEAIDKIAGDWAYFGDSEQYARIYRDRLNSRLQAPFHGFFSEEQLEETQSDAEGAPTPRCSVCHTGGGLLMKELDNPWLHWDTDKTMPGVATLFDEAGLVLGGSLSAPELERTVVKPGNTAWNTQRINNILAEGDAVDLLTPLFCTVDVNLQTGDRSAEGASAVTNWPDFLVNEVLLDGRSTPPGLALDGFRLGSSSYLKALEAIGQGIFELGIEDTFKRFVYAEAAHADTDYIRQIRDAELVSADFVEDVLAVDVTRPVFSDERCILLEHVSRDLEISSDLRDRGLEAPVAKRRQFAKQLVEAVTASLDAVERSEGEEALLANIREEGAASLDERLTTLGQKCAMRAATGANGFHLDMLRIAAARRNLTRHDARVIEFGATMPGDEFWGENNKTEEGKPEGLADVDVFFDDDCRISE